MQKLFVTIKGKDGKEDILEVLVSRSWATASGATLFLHASGVYGYLDTAPVRTEEELYIIENKAQRAAALKWWQFYGKALSEKYYSEVEAREQAAQGDFQNDGAIPVTELDCVLYQSRTKGGTWALPFSWMSKFPARPDWWGQADSIAFKDVEYRVAGAPGADVADAPVKVPGKKIAAGEI